MSLDVFLAGHPCTLLPQRALWWARHQALVLSDLHVGKAAHFRKAGLALPRGPFEDDLARLDSLLEQWTPRQVIVTGDLFHSAHNREVEAFGRWRQGYGQSIDFHLVRGNHDILRATSYGELGLITHQTLVLDGLAFSHYLPAPGETTLFHITGHLHPGIELYGAGRQRLRLPCFFAGQNGLILPAFSRLTGLALVRPGEGDRVFAIAGEEVIEV